MDGKRSPTIEKTGESSAGKEHQEEECPPATHLDRITNLAKVEVHVAVVELVLLGRQHDLLHLRSDACDLGHVHAVVVDAKAFVHHRLVRPLIQKWCDGVVPAVHN